MGQKSVRIQMIKLEKLNKNRSNDQQWPWSNIISIVILTTGGGGGGGTAT